MANTEMKGRESYGLESNSQLINISKGEVRFNDLGVAQQRLMIEGVLMNL